MSPFAQAVAKTVVGLKRQSTTKLKTAANSRILKWEGLYRCVNAAGCLWIATTVNVHGIGRSLLLTEMDDWQEGK